MYASSNPKTKKALKEAVKARQEYKKLQECGPLTIGAVLACKQVVPPQVACHQPGPFGPTVADGVLVCEGPHYPQPHRWYASCEVVDDFIVKVKA